MSTTTARSRNVAKESGGNLQKLLEIHQLQLLETMDAMLLEARVQTQILAQGFGIKDDLDKLRAEEREKLE